MEAVRPIRPRRIRDKDGSLGGGPNSYVLINDGVNDSIAVDAEACEIKPTWNAAVCKGDVGRLNFGGGGGGRWSAVLLAGAGCQAQLPVPAQLLVPALPQVPVRPGAPGAPGGRGGAPAGAPAQPPVVLSRNGKEYTVTGQQRTSRYRDQGDHRKADRVPHPDGTGSRLVGDLRAAGIHHRSLGYAAGQPGCAAQGQRHLVLQGQGCALGQGGLQR